MSVDFTRAVPGQFVQNQEVYRNFRRTELLRQIAAQVFKAPGVQFRARGQVRDWLFVADHCSAIERVIEKGRLGETYNVGGNGERTNIEIVRTICKLLDEHHPGSAHRPHEQLIKFVQDRPGHDRRYAMDAGKVRRELGWRPREDFASGLERTVRWYLDNPRWVENVTSGTYRRERLGLLG